MVKDYRQFNSTKNVHARAKVERHDRVEGPGIGCHPETDDFGLFRDRVTAYSL